VRHKDEEIQKQALGAAIRARRKTLGLSRRDLERQTEISYPYLSEIEAGKKNPSNSMLQRIGEALQTTPSELMAMAERTMEQPDLAMSPMHAPPPAAASISSPAMASPSQPSPVRTKGFFHKGKVEMLPEPAEEDPLIELLRIARGLPRHELELLLEVARRFDGSP
jgi:transcriptional regulator with XRE-family HTH domain